MRFRFLELLAPKATFRRKHGIAPRGKGPHPPSAYGLPLPPKGHPLAKQFARAVLARAHQAKAGGRFDPAAVDRQVKKARRILGQPTAGKEAGYHFGPCEESCARALEPFRSRAQQRWAFATSKPFAKKWGNATKKAPGGFKRLGQYAPGSTSPNKKRKIGKKIPVDSPAYRRAARAGHESGTREAMIYGGSVAAPHDSHEHVKDAIEKAAKADKRFHSPDSTDEWNISVPLTYPHTKKAVVSNSRSGKMWIAPYSMNDAGECALGEPQEATMDVVPTDAQTTLASLRESGHDGAVLMPFHLTVEVREGATIFNDDGSVRSLVIREGDGNAVDNNYYQRSFVESLIPLLEGADCFYNHESASQAKELPERDVRDKAGWWESPAVEDVVDEHGNTVAGGWAKFHPRVGDATVSSLLRTTQEKMRRYPEKAPFVAFSINGFGAGEAGKSPRDGSDKNLLEVATRLKSVDMVTYAGAGGRPTFRESNTMKHKPGCTCGKTGCPSLRASRAQESGRRDPFDGVVELDIRTQEEIEDDNLQTAEAARAATREALLKGPLGKGIREAAKLPANFRLERATDAQIKAIDEAAGIAGEEYVDRLVESVGDGEQQVEGEETEEDVEQTGDELDGETGRLSAEDIDAMDADEVRAELKKRATGGATGTGGATSESARVTNLEKQLAQMQTERRQRNRESFIASTMDDLKFPEGPHREVARSIVESVREPKEIVKRLRAYKEANIVPARMGERGGNIGAMRESAGNGLQRLSTGVKRQGVK